MVLKWNGGGWVGKGGGGVVGDIPPSHGGAFFSMRFGNITTITL